MRASALRSAGLPKSARPGASPKPPTSLHPASGGQRAGASETEKGWEGPGPPGARRAPSPPGRCARAPDRGGARPRCPVGSRPKRLEVVRHLSGREKTGHRRTSRAQSPNRVPSAALEPSTESQRSPEAAGGVPGDRTERAPSDRRAPAHSCADSGAEPRRHAHADARTARRAHTVAHTVTHTRGHAPWHARTDSHMLTHAHVAGGPGLPCCFVPG